MKTPFKISELVCLSIIFAGLIMNLFDLDFAYLISGIGSIIIGIIGLTDSVKYKFYIPLNGKIMFPTLNLLTISLGISGIINETSHSTALLMVLLLYSMHIRKERSNELVANGK